MKKYRVIVDGTEYEIGIEALDDAALHPPATASAAAPPPSVENKKNTSGGERILSPMPGNILSVRVQSGGAVKKGQVLLILEAMKMENEIIAPRDAVVLSMDVSSGMTVDTGTLLCVLQ